LITIFKSAWRCAEEKEFTLLSNFNKSNFLSKLVSSSFKQVAFGMELKKRAQLLLKISILLF